MYSRRIAEEVGEPDLDHHWTQEILRSESVKFGGPHGLVGVSLNMAKVVKWPNREKFEYPGDMARTNLDMLPRKRIRGIAINKWRANPPKKGRTEPPKGGKGKGKRPMTEVPEHNSGNEGDSFDS
uniref:Uncharacterized protein n=1 Tax=Solanum tuberosum TaxID=4113 RepID=M1DI78_SOLTU